MITYNLFASCPDLIHFSTERDGGVSVGSYASLNLSPFTGDMPENVQENVKRLCSELHMFPEQLVLPFQTHGTEVRIIHDSFHGWSPGQQRDYLNGVDALITDISQICICVTTADCVPLLLFDPVSRAIGVAHAGWRGTCGRIAGKTVQAMCTNFASRPEDIRVVIGPSVSPAVYQVGPELVAQFESSGFDVDSLFVRHEDALFLDLWAANRQSLVSAGVEMSHIETSELCTFTHHERFFSARRLGIQSGRILSGIMLR